ncbi:hypothetical protein RUM44_000885 [Polyplax serrata]|uniref:Retinol dehydrogenase 13 n=1 Tax=Polyplax serrata TaxID=468196 RepID=A0ABR1B8V2_POLSC
MEDPFERLSTADPFGSWWPFIIAVSVGIIMTVRTYFGGTPCPSKATINGKTVVITGGSSGIGREVVVELLSRGGRIIIGSRNPEEALKSISKAIGKCQNVSRIISYFLDLTSLQSVREFVKKLDNENKIDILINNAGVAFQDFEKTGDGFEIHLATNYLGHFLLTHLLLPKLKKAEAARIINVSAQAHYVGDLCLNDLNLEDNYSYNKAFSQSKLALVMMARHMEKILRGTNVTINAMHPGLIRGTKQFQKSPMGTSFLVKMAIWPWAWLFMKTPSQGAQTIIYMAVALEVQDISGKYFRECNLTDPSIKATDDATAEKFYKKSLELTGLSPTEFC